MKLVVNMLMGTVIAGLAESMALAEKIGLDQAELLRVLMMSTVQSPLLETKGTGKIFVKRFCISEKGNNILENMRKTRDIMNAAR